jgi:hypothetical protein
MSTHPPNTSDEPRLVDYAPRGPIHRDIIAQTAAIRSISRNNAINTALTLAVIGAATFLILRGQAVLSNSNSGTNHGLAASINAHIDTVTETLQGPVLGRLDMNSSDRQYLRAQLDALNARVQALQDAANELVKRGSIVGGAPIQAPVKIVTVPEIVPTPTPVFIPGPSAPPLPPVEVCTTHLFVFIDCRTRPG